MDDQRRDQRRELHALPCDNIGGDFALLDRYACQRLPPRTTAHGIDMRYAALLHAVDGNPALLVEFDAGGIKVQPGSVRTHSIGDDERAFVDTGSLNLCADLDAQFAQTRLDEAQGGGIDPWQKLLTWRAEFHLDAEPRENGCQLQGNVVVAEDAQRFR